jgi:molecular chaperone GrpE
MKEKDVNNTAAENEFNTADRKNEETIDINSDSDVPGTSHLADPLVENEIEKLRAELNETKDKYVRLVAEFDNFRKRGSKEKLELIQTAGRDVIVSLLEVIDDSERAQKQLETSDDIQAIREGVVLVFNKFRNMLQSKGLKAMESINQEFNPDMHEAITEIPAPTQALVGKVVDEVQKGYYLNDKIIRFAKVVVGK